MNVTTMIILSSHVKCMTCYLPVCLIVMIDTILDFIEPPKFCHQINLDILSRSISICIRKKLKEIMRNMFSTE